MPIQEKAKIVPSSFENYLNLNTHSGRVNFVLCIVFLFSILSTQNSSGFYILFKNLIKAIKEGRISKVVGRAIIRKLKKRGIPIDPELLEVVSS